MSPTEFWGSNHYEHPPLTDEMLDAAETRLGVKLPPLLVELLRYQNGGFTKDFGYPMSVPTSWAEDHVQLEELFGIVTDTSIRTAQNMIKPAYIEEERGIPEKQVLLCGDGHWWITLDYRMSENPSVLYLDTEMEESAPIANSFEEFYAGLVPIVVFQPEED